MASRKAFLVRNLEDVEAHYPDNEDALTWVTASGKWMPVPGGGGGGGHIIQDEGVDQTQRTNLNFTGNAVTVLDDSDNDATKITIGLVSGILSQEVYETLTAQVVSGISHFSLSDKILDDSLRVYYNGVRQQSNYFVVDPGNEGFTTAFVVQNGDEIFVDYETTTSGVGILDAHFTSLLDTPSSYTGAGADFLKVNAGEDAVEFVTVAVVEELDDLSDVTILNPTAAQMLYYNVISGWTNEDIPLGYLGNVVITDPQDSESLQYDSDTGKWVNQSEAAPSAFPDLTDTPANYTAASGKYVKVNDAEDALIFQSVLVHTWKGTTDTLGLNENRDTGGAFAYAEQPVQIARPMKLASVLWDIRKAEDYTLTVRMEDGTVLATVVVLGVGEPAVEEPFVLDTPLIMDAGYYRFRLTAGNNVTWSDHNGDVDHGFNSFLIYSFLDYGGTEYPEFRGPFQLVYYDSILN